MGNPNSHSPSNNQPHIWHSGMPAKHKCTLYSLSRSTPNRTTLQYARLPIHASRHICNNSHRQKSTRPQKPPNQSPCQYQMSHSCNSNGHLNPYNIYDNNTLLRTTPTTSNRLWIKPSPHKRLSTPISSIQHNPSTIHHTPKLDNCTPSPKGTTTNPAQK